MRHWEGTTTTDANDGGDLGCVPNGLCPDTVLHEDHRLRRESQLWKNHKPIYGKFAAPESERSLRKVDVSAIGGAIVQLFVCIRNG